MDRASIGEALEYLYWARDRIAVAAAALTDAEFCCEVPRATRTLRGTLAHQVECEWAWRIRLGQGAFPHGDVLPDDFATLGDLLARWRLDESALLALVDGLSDADLEANVTVGAGSVATWRCILYVVNHGTQQFTEAALLLTQLGHSPGEIGYLAFCSRPPRR